MARTVGIIPARLGSTRFPGKVLANATGQTLIQHVHDAAVRASSLTEIVIATDDERVMAAASSFGARSVMTRADHPNGTSRLAEASGLLGLAPGDVVVNIQGDEPELDSGVIDAAVQALRESGADAATAASPIVDGAEIENPNIVKVVRRGDGCALYFSRSPIPFRRTGAPIEVLRHIGLYAYTCGVLGEYVRMPSTPLEAAESLEQLRLLEHGRRIAVAIVSTAASGIDTPGQYDAFVARWNAAH